MSLDEEYGPMGDDFDRLKIIDAIAAATTWEAVEEIQATCQHSYYLVGKRWECQTCGKHISDDEYFEIDDIPF